MFLRKTIKLMTYMPGNTMNCYIYYCPDTMKGILIDPGDFAEDLIEWAEEHGVALERIVLTHGHVDHVGAAAEIRETHGLPISIHKKDLHMLAEPVLNLSSFVARLPFRMPIGAVDVLEHGDVISVGKLSAEVMHIPGHTPGGICLKTEEGIFTGDVLFKGTIGRGDFPDGDLQELIDGIRAQLLVLPDSTPIFPGHDDISTIGFERKFNVMIM
jgi:glyoxylase-like metal-dependent hydrolase (beta-lactamase superfamily II)